jgi:hypothetical protein
LKSNHALFKRGKGLCRAPKWSSLDATLRVASHGTYSKGTTVWGSADETSVLYRHLFFSTFACHGLLVSCPHEVTSTLPPHHKTPTQPPKDPAATSTSLCRVMVTRQYLEIAHFTAFTYLRARHDGRLRAKTPAPITLHHTTRRSYNPPRTLTPL